MQLVEPFIVVAPVLALAVWAWRSLRSEPLEMAETRFPDSLKDIDTSWLERHGIEPSSPAPLERKAPVVRTVRQRKEVARRIDVVESSVTSSWMPVANERRD